jgi:hypothetical protein
VKLDAERVASRQHFAANILYPFGEQTRSPEVSKTPHSLHYAKFAFSAGNVGVLPGSDILTLLLTDCRRLPVSGNFAVLR